MGGSQGAVVMMEWMPFKPVVFLTDLTLYGIVFVLAGSVVWTARQKNWRAVWFEVMQRKLAVMALVVLLFYVLIALLDSVHFRPALAETNHGKTFYSTQVVSVLDVLMGPRVRKTEESYSAPFATRLYNKKVVVKETGEQVRGYPLLKYGGSHLREGFVLDVVSRVGYGVAEAVGVWFVGLFVFCFFQMKRQGRGFRVVLRAFFLGESKIAWREGFLALLVSLLVVFVSKELIGFYHLMGTDKVGHDIFYESVKSIRTGIVIGTVTTLLMLPFALLFGMVAGYLGGWADDIIQYFYTTLSSIPGVLLISAAILSLQIIIGNHPEYFPTLADRADVRLLVLCVILGVTSWTGLCRLVRAETLKLRQTDFVEAALALGVSRVRAMFRHVLPNLMHIVLITVVLDFSGLVLAEAVLSYVGVGVDPTMMSWGNMINSARLELAREPVVWWPLLAAFVFMFILVLVANLFADAVRDAFDPRLRHGNS